MANENSGRIGYACLTLGVRGADFKSCTMKNAGPENLLSLTEHNLRSLARIIDYNAEEGIRLFRISSDLIPFGSSPVNALSWHELFSDRFDEIGKKIRAQRMRVSMHPGQYTVLNSPDIGVAERAAEDLRYHARVLDSLGLGTEHKIILHIGGAYGDKREAATRFTDRFRLLEDSVRHRLALENDDRSFHIGDVLELSAKLNLPVVYDNLHNALNPCDPARDDRDWIDRCRETWTTADGPQKIHYSEQDPDKKPGSHSKTVRIGAFLEFTRMLPAQKPDIMLEVKDKNLSAVKCLLCTAEGRNIGALEREWSRYKYTVLERAPALYARIRRLLRQKNAYPAEEFYTLVERSQQQTPLPGTQLNAALHIWGYFRDLASEDERREFQKRSEALRAGTGSAAPVKKLLWNMAQKHRCGYLLDSFYFLY